MALAIEPKPGPVLVTGAAKRVGAAIAEHLAGKGHHVVIHASSSIDEARALAARIGGSAVQADLTDLAAVGHVVGGADQAAGAPIQHIVNNASFFQETTASDATYEDLDTMMRLHAWAPWVLARGLAGRQGASVVNMLDTRITSHDPRHFTYLLSKNALAHLTRTLAKELAPVRVNGIAPGPILAPSDGADDALEAAVEATVLGRQGTPEEIAHAVSFLIDAEYTTGEVLFVDGGRHLKT